MTPCKLGSTDTKLHSLDDSNVPIGSSELLELILSILEQAQAPFHIVEYSSTDGRRQKILGLPPPVDVIEVLTSLVQNELESLHVTGTQGKV